MMVFLQPAMSVFEAVSMIALQLLRESYTLLPDSTTMLVKPGQRLYLQVVLYQRFAR